MDVSKLLKRTGAVGYLLLILLPLTGFHLTQCTWRDMIISPRQASLLWNSILLASVSALAACAAGTLVAVAIRSSSLSESAFRWIFLITAPLPYYIYALSWMYGVRWISRWNRDLASYGYRGLAACIFVETMTFLPLCAAMALFGMEQQDHKEEDMAFLYQKDISVIRCIVFPRILPYLTAAFGCVFILSITDYSVPSLFQFNTYIMDLFSEYSRGAGMAHVAGKSLPLIGLVFLFLALIQGNLRQFTVPGPGGTGKRWCFKGGARCFPAMGMILGISQMLIPIVIFLVTAGSIPTIWDSFLLIKRELWVSIEMSLLAGILSVLISYGMARLILESKKFTFLLWQIALFPLAIPGPLVAMGLLTAVNGSPVHGISQTILLPAIGYTIRYMPFSLMIIAARLRRMEKRKIEMGRLLAPGMNRAFWKVELPMIFPGAFAAFCIVVLLSMGEEGIGLVLMPAGLETLAVKVYNYLHYGASELISGFSLVTMIVTGCAITALLRVMEEKKGR